jgi:hypothetical protein
MTTKRLRSLTPESACALLKDYVQTDMGYRALEQKYGGSQNMIGPLVRGLTYRELNDEFPGFAHLREQAQAKAAKRSALHTKAVGVRVPDIRTMVIEVHSNSIQSVDAAITRLREIKSFLLQAEARKIA